MSEPGKITRTVRRRMFWPVLIGAAAGLLTWLYDYEFFLNAGGPKRPISDAILRATGTASAPPLIIILWPGVALVLLGIAVGYVISRIAGSRRRHATK